MSPQSLRHHPRYNEAIRLRETTQGMKVISGQILDVDTENQTITVNNPVAVTDADAKVTVPIGNMFTQSGVGFRMMPISRITYANVYIDTHENYYHIGYDLHGVENSTDDISGEKQDNKPTQNLMRNLKEGEVQMAGRYGSEVLLSTDGNVLIKSQFGAYMKLDNYLSRLEGNFANLQYNMDRVRIRAGNILRPTADKTTEDQYIVVTKAGEILGADQLTDDDLTGQTYYPLKEFSVQVGTYPNSTSYTDDILISPTVGTFSIADACIKEDGSVMASAGSTVQAMLEMRNGGGFKITADGSFHILDKNTWSPTKFGTGAAERALRIEKSYISIAETMDPYKVADITYSKEAVMHDESGTEIAIRYGAISLIDYSSRGIIIDPAQGINLMAPESYVNILAQNVNVSLDGGVMTVGSSLTAMPDSLLKANGSALWFPLHTHLGPSGTVNSATNFLPSLLTPKPGMPCLVASTSLTAI